MKRSIGRTVFPVMLILAALSPSPAYAYLDPGTASLVLQGIIGAIGAGFIVLSGYWRKFTNLFKKQEPEANAEKEEDRTAGSKHTPG